MRPGGLRLTRSAMVVLRTPRFPLPKRKKSTTMTWLCLKVCKYFKWLHHSVYLSKLRKTKGFQVIQEYLYSLCLGFKKFVTQKNIDVVQSRQSGRMFSDQVSNIFICFFFTSCYRKILRVFVFITISFLL